MTAVEPSWMFRASLIFPSLFLFWLLSPEDLVPPHTATSNRRLDQNSLFVVKEFDPIHSLANLDGLSHMSTEGSKKDGGQLDAQSSSSMSTPGVLPQH